MAYPNTPQNVAAITNADRYSLLSTPPPLASWLTPSSLGTKPTANAAAVDGPPMAAFDAVSTSSQPGVGHRDFLDMPNFRLARAPMYFSRHVHVQVTDTTVMECMSNAREAKANAVGPPATADDKSAVVPTAAKRR